MTKLKIKISYLLFLISLIAHLFAYLEYRWLMHDTTLPSQWHGQFNSLLLFSLLLSFILAVTTFHRLLLLSLRFISLIIIGYPLGRVLGIEVVLLLTIILETIYYFTPKYGIIASVIQILITTLNQKPTAPWGTAQEGVDSHNLLLLIFISLLILVLSSMIKRFSELLSEKNSDLERLNFAVEELTKINLDYQNYAKTVEYDSVENERKRVSRELHDIIGYTLTNQLMIIHAALSMKEPLPEKLKDLLLQAQTQTREGMTDARSALYKLRDFIPQREVGLKLIFKLTRTFGKLTGVEVNMDFGNVPMTMGRAIDSTLYRLIQEGMINAFRHGKATRIDISLFRAKEKVHLSISDNGRGTKTLVEGIGLKGMRERLTGVGGSLKISALPGGFTIKAYIPYASQATSEEGGRNEDITG